MRRRLIALIVCVVLAGALGQAASGPAAAEPKPTNPSPATTQQTPLEQTQERLTAVTDQIEALVAREHQARYTGVEIVPEQNRVIVYWVGQLPASVQAILTSAQRQGITTEVRQAKHSKAQLDKARHAVLRDPRARAVGISLVYSNADGSGITVGVAGSLSAARELDAVRNSPVRVALYSQPFMKPALGRYNDTSPFWGGVAYYVFNASRACTTGFGVHNSAGTTYILTAAHCFRDVMGDDTAVLDPRDPSRWIARAGMGKTFREWHTSRVDAGIIDARAGAHMYTQGIDPYYSYVAVAGSGNSTYGAYVKTSGSFSGERSGIQVKNVNATYGFWANGTFWELDGVMAEKTNHTNAVGEGDSGGPVFTTLADGRAVALGIISAIDTSTRVGCTGITQVPSGSNVVPRTCAWRMFYAKVTRALSVGGLSINTSS